MTILKMLELIQTSHSLVLRLLPDDTGVENHNVGILRALRGSIAETLKPGGHTLGVRHVHLTSNGPNMILHFLNNLMVNHNHILPLNERGAMPRARQNFADRRI
jgi:hypothetical protein